MPRELQQLRDAEFEATLTRLQEAEDQRAASADGNDESARPARRELERFAAVSFDRPFLFRPGRWGRLRGMVLMPFKAALRPLMRWYVQPFALDQRQFNAGVLRVADELASSSKQLEEWNRDRMEEIAQLWEQYEQLSQHLPIVLNAIATQNATAREFERARSDFAPSARLEQDEALIRDHEARLTTLAQNLTYVDRRSEFIRREVMYEARYGAQARGVEQVAAEDVDLSSFPQPLRLNLGSGHIPREGYVNVDARKLDGVDVAADVRRLPFGPGTVEEIYSSHLVEHFPIEELRSVVLPHWRDLLRPGGRLVAVVPDAEAMVRETAEGRMPFDDFQRVMFGDQEYDGDFHFSTYTPDSLSALLMEAGFEAVEIVDRARRNGLAYEFEIGASRPAAEKAVPEHATAGDTASTK
jgi:predicted SAM-dependent methyltransferase